MKRAVNMLLGVLALPSVLYTVALTYLSVTQQVPHQAALAGSYGVVVGMVTIAGLGLAKMFYDLAHSPIKPYFPGYLLAACMLVMVGLFAAMRWAGEFGERIFGPYAIFLDFGFYLGVPLGMGMLAASWLDQQRKL